MAVTKIATCCYCGTKAALVLRGHHRHELSCGSCGAPLHVMKALPIASGQVTAPAATPTRPKAQKTKPKKQRHVSRPGKRRKSKGFGRRIWEEVWDVIEDVFD